METYLTTRDVGAGLSAIRGWAEGPGGNIAGEDAENIRIHAEGMFKNHVKKLLLETLGEILLVETILQAEILPGVILAGKIDAIVQRGLDICIVDHKTHTIFPADLWSRLPHDAQVLRYLWLARANNWKAIGVIYTVASKCGIRGKSAESTSTKDARISAWYEEQGAKNIHYEEARPGNGDVAACIEGARVTAREIVLGKRIKHEESCEGRYGMCPYFDLCMKQTWDGVGDIPLGFRTKTSTHEELTT